jgi:hypothetical protein
MKLKPTNNFSHLWNDLPYDERERLMPHMVERQKLHVWQCKQKAIAAHKRHMKELDDWLSSLDAELSKYNALPK